MKGNSAGFPKFNAQVPLPPSAKADPPLLPASAIGSETGIPGAERQREEL